MNTFHWHITDSQSFPLIVAEFPELAQKGAYGSHQVYSPHDVEEVVAYAGAVSGPIFLILGASDQYSL